MTALQLLLSELATNGPTTYDALYAKYGPRGCDLPVLRADVLNKGGCYDLSRMRWPHDQ